MVFRGAFRPRAVSLRTDWNPVKIGNWMDTWSRTGPVRNLAGKEMDVLIGRQ